VLGSQACATTLSPTDPSPENTWMLCATAVLESQGITLTKDTYI
jgi:hypothetical protein